MTDLFDKIMEVGRVAPTLNATSEIAFYLQDDEWQSVFERFKEKYKGSIHEHVPETVTNEFHLNGVAVRKQSELGPEKLHDEAYERGFQHAIEIARREYLEARK